MQAYWLKLPYPLRLLLMVIVLVAVTKPWFAKQQRALHHQYRQNALQQIQAQRFVARFSQQSSTNAGLQKLLDIKMNQDKTVLFEDRSEQQLVDLLTAAKQEELTVVQAEITARNHSTGKVDARITFNNRVN